jgi:hypothetical protein
VVRRTALQCYTATLQTSCSDLLQRRQQSQTRTRGSGI